VYTRVNKEKPMSNEFSGKIIQIIPAPAGMFAVYRGDDGDEFRLPIVALGLTDIGKVVPLEIDGLDVIWESGDDEGFLRFDVPGL
jgi:hypothetical protein